VDGDDHAVGLDRHAGHDPLQPPLSRRSAGARAQRARCGREWPGPTSPGPGRRLQHDALVVRDAPAGRYAGAVAALDDRMVHLAGAPAGMEADLAAAVAADRPSLRRPLMAPGALAPRASARLGSLRDRSLAVPRASGKEGRMSGAAGKPLQTGAPFR